MILKPPAGLFRLLLGVGLALWPVPVLAQVADTQAPDSDRMEINGRLLPPIVAYVNGQAIPGTLLANQVQMYKMVHQQQGHALTPEQEADYAQETLNDLIGQELLFQKSKEWGIEVEDKEVRAEEHKVRSQFPSEEMFQHALNLQGLNEELLHRSIQRQLVEEKVITTKIAPTVDVSEHTVKTYYEDHLDQFMQPPRWEISHVFVAALKQEEPEDPALLERFHTLQKMVETDARAKIEKAQAALKAGQSFVDVAEKFSEHEETRKNGGKWGTMAREEMPEEIYRAVSKLKPGETSGIVRSEYGFHILHLDATFPEEAIPLERVKADLLNHLLKEEVEQAKDKLVEELRDDADVEVYF